MTPGELCTTFLSLQRGNLFFFFLHMKVAEQTCPRPLTTSTHRRSRMFNFIKTETELRLQPEQPDLRGNTAADPRAEMVKGALLEILDEMDDKNFDRFKFYLRDDRLSDEYVIAKSKLKKASRCETVDLMVEVFTLEHVAGVASDILQMIKRNDLAMKLEEKVEEEED
ncbi:NACHT%2C LRR and PYD domains-containing protein 6-like [Xyrichtys novacula]|uniref:NACHT, LRR and PYD domains-containing protein 6-like n=1 Tax=Xyrichtys novacula TaxID=13765 RepID=A0AAV1EZW9_XYRNO|nr:NACHT%2C LRR and PYD domains-containing protein 6-like [Xyrichtys novacula]